MGSSDSTYICALAEFIDKQIGKWAKQKKNHLEPKLTANYEAVTNKDFRMKRWKKEEGQGWRSTTWIGMVRVKVWSFYAILLDTVLKAGKIPFSLEPSPYDEIEDEAYIQDRDRRIERMTKKIEGQLAARKADREYMNKWLSGAYYGMAFSKFDIDPVKHTKFKMVDMGMGEAQQYMSPEEISQYTRYEMVQDEEDTPGHRYVSVWNMVWDMEANDLQSGAGYAEHIPSSAYDLRRLIDKPGYVKDAILRVIERNLHDEIGKDSGESISEHPAKTELQERKQKFKRYEYYMLAPRKMVDEFEKLLKSGKTDVYELGNMISDYEDAEESGDDVEIMGEIVDKDIVRHVRNNTGKRAHHMWVIEKNLDESTGTGIADNMEDVQSSLVGMVRAFEDNKKLSANVTTAVKKRFFSNANQLDDVIPGKQYDINDQCDDVRKAIMPITFADVGESLVSGISLMKQFSDDVSMIPTIMQGFTLPKHQPDTAYEMRQLTENAGKYIGQAIRNNDEQFIEPEINDIYIYNMLYDPDESCKVNCKVVANGFTSFQNKEIRGERMKMALGMFISNEILLPYVKVKPHLDVIYESMDEDPEKFIKSDEEREAEAQQQAEMQAQAEQKALAMAQEQAAAQHAQEIEKSAVAHAQKLTEAEQAHINEMENEVVKAKLDVAKAPLNEKPKESQGGSE